MERHQDQNKSVHQDKYMTQEIKEDQKVATKYKRSFLHTIYSISNSCNKEKHKNPEAITQAHIRR